MKTTSKKNKKEDDLKKRKKEIGCDIIVNYPCFDHDW